MDGETADDDERSGSGGVSASVLPICQFSFLRFTAASLGAATHSVRIEVPPPDIPPRHRLPLLHACLPAYLPVCLRPCYLAGFLTTLPPSFFPTHLPAYLLPTSFIDVGQSPPDEVSAYG
eukprot:GHVU01210465.1.p1 GENE.GHVU01210465.1~~GHVU01210465.1.p1  ORF type:complete len:120 (+),score=10.96 GHVU01210465.1:237-596(+)